MSIIRILGKHRPPGHAEETAVHHTISYHLSQAHTAHLRSAPSGIPRPVPPATRGQAGPGTPDPPGRS